MERPSISEIMCHEWYNGPVPTAGQVRNEFELRRSLLKKENYQPEAEKPTAKPDPTVLGEGEFRSLELKENEERTALPYVPEFERFTQFFSTFSPEKLFETVAVFAGEKCKEVRFDPKEYCATMTTDDEYEIELRINILDVEGTDKHCVEVIKESGDRFQFDHVYKSIRETFGGYVDAKEP